METVSSDGWDVETDLVVGGSGIGAVTAAITADELGLDVVVLEKAAKLGGVSGISGGELWVGDNHLAAAAGVADSREETKAYIRDTAPNDPVEPLLTALVDTAPEALEFLEERADVEWLLIEDLPDYLYPDAEGSKAEGRYVEVAPIPEDELGDWAEKILIAPDYPVGLTHEEMFSMGSFAGFLEWDFDLWGERIESGILTGGTGVMASLLADLRRRDVTVHTETPIREVIEADGQVVGVRATQDGEDRYVGGDHGVFLALGGYDWNVDLVEEYEFVPPEEWRSASPPSVEGDHFGLLEALDAAVFAFTDQARLPGFMPGFQVPGEQLEGEPHHRLITSFLGSPGCIIVNADGERFCNEAFYHDFIATAGEYDVQKSELVNWPCYAIFDWTHRSKYPLGSIQPGEDLPAGLGHQANSLVDVATELGIDPDGLEATVATFNEFAAEGTDPAFERGETPWQRLYAGDPNASPHPNLAPLDEPPFFGFRLRAVGIDIPRAGLEVTPDAQVLDEAGDPIANLYAGGNSVAYRDTGGSYNSGYAMTRGMVHGYSAAHHASED